MTQKLYYEQPNLNEVQAKITNIFRLDEKIISVQLDRTLFYPEGGGQPADGGWIDGEPIVDVQTTQRGIEHHIALAEGLQWQINQTVQLKLDRDRRDDHMVQHSAQHLLSSILHKVYHSQTVSFHLGSDYATVDFESAPIESVSLVEIESQVNRAIRQLLPFYAKIFPTKADLSDVQLRRLPQVEEQIRVVFIEGYDAAPCGGTHVQNSGEIGMFKLIRREKIRDCARLFFLAGRRALTDYQVKQQLVEQISNALTCHENDIIPKMRLEEENVQRLRLRCQQMEKALLDSYVESVRVANTPYIHIWFEESFADMGFLQNLAKQLEQKDRILLLVSQMEKKLLMISQHDHWNVGKILKQYVGTFSGKGGGSPVRGQAMFDDVSSMRSFYGKMIELMQTLS